MSTNLRFMPLGVGIGFLVVMLGAIMLFPSFGINPAFAALSIIAIAISAPLIAQPRYLFWIFFVWAFILQLAQEVFSLARFGDELFILLWLFIILGLVSFRRLHVRDPWFVKMLLAFITLCVLSTLLNGSNLKKMALFLMSYVFPLATFYLARAFLNPKRDMVIFCRMVVGLFFLQLILNLGWALHINPLPNRWLYTHDFAIGSFSSQTHVSYFCCILLITTLGAIFHAKTFKHRALLLLFALLVVIQLVATFTLHAYFLLGVAFVVYLFLFSGKRFWIVVPSCAVVGMVGIMLMISISEKFVFEARDAQSIREELSSDNLRWRWEKMVMGPKGQCYVDAFYRAPSETPWRWLVGAGAGDFLSTVAMFQQPFSDVTLRYLGKYYLTYTGEMELAGHSITQVVVASPPALMGDLGLFGLILYSSMVAGVLLVVMKNLYKKRYRSALQIALAKGFVVSFVFIFFVSLLSDVLGTDWLIILFTTWASFIIDPLDDEQDTDGDQQRGQLPQRMS